MSCKLNIEGFCTLNGKKSKMTCKNALGTVVEQKDCHSYQKPTK